MTALENGYYAVADPDDPAVTTCWRWSSSGRNRGLSRWSGGAMYGTPTELSRGRPPRPWTAEVRAAANRWFREVLDAIKGDPAAAGLRFAGITGRCFRCGKALTDPESVVLGIGPDCGGRR